MELLINLSFVIGIYLVFFLLKKKFGDYKMFSQIRLITSLGLVAFLAFTAYQQNNRQNIYLSLVLGMATIGYALKDLKKDYKY